METIEKIDHSEKIASLAVGLILTAISFSGYTQKVAIGKTNTTSHSSALQNVTSTYKVVLIRPITQTERHANVLPEKV